QRVIVSVRRERVYRLNQRLTRPDAVHRGVVGRGVAHQQIRIRRGRELREKRGKVELTDLAGSTRARRERPERGVNPGVVSHAEIMSRGQGPQGPAAASLFESV